MSHRVGASLVAALLFTGCAVPAATGPSGAGSAPGDSIAPRYATMAAQSSPVAIAGLTASSVSADVAASSERDASWFAFGHLTDANLHSAWSPAEADEHPTITLDLGARSRVTGLGIKMDAGATFDVAVDDGDGWKTLATAVAPTYGALDFVALAATDARRIRLSFHRATASPLLVCDVRLFTGGEAGSPTPAPTATPGADDCLSFGGGGELDVIDRAANRLVDGGRFYFQDVVLSGGHASGVFLVADGNGVQQDDYLVTAVARSGDRLVVDGTSLDGTATASVELRMTSTTAGGFQAVPSRVTISAGAASRVQVFPAADTLTSMFQLDGTTNVCALPAPVPSPTGCVTVETAEGGSEEIPRDSFYPNLYYFHGVRATASGYAGTFTNDGASLNPVSYRVTAIATSENTITVTGVPVPALDRLGNPGVPGPYVRVQETITVTEREGDRFRGYVSRSERFDNEGHTSTITFDATHDNAGQTFSNVSFTGSLGACATD
jgi:hypothetical protein